MNWKGAGGCGRGLTEALSLNLPSGTEKNHRTLRIAGVHAEI
jgi:hypothetical protein